MIMCPYATGHLKVVTPAFLDEELNKMKDEETM